MLHGPLLILINVHQNTASSLEKRKVTCGTQCGSINSYTIPSHLCWPYRVGSINNQSIAAEVKLRMSVIELNLVKLVIWRVLNASLNV